MGQLFLVRHAQASFPGRNYDRLSQTGETQARLLGEYWARHRVMFDRVYSGPRTRQTETARIVGEACRQAGLAFLPQQGSVKKRTGKNCKNRQKRRYRTKLNPQSNIGTCCRGAACRAPWASDF